jgi:hypothetical protein
MNYEVHKDETSGKGINAEIKHNTNVKKQPCIKGSSHKE